MTEFQDLSHAELWDNNTITQSGGNSQQNRAGAVHQDGHSSTSKEGTALITLSLTALPWFLTIVDTLPCTTRQRYQNASAKLIVLRIFD